MDIQQSLRLDDQVAIITGASKGIGKSVAEALGKAGARVIVSSRKKEAVEEVAHELQQQGAEVLPLPANVGRPEEVAQLVAQTQQHFGGIDILVNNAAANPSFGPVEEIEDWAYDKIMDVNVKGPFLLSKLALPSMRERGGGAVLNISSIGGVSPEYNLGIYSVSKAALISLTKVQAREWGRYQVRSNVICPGLIKTQFSEPLWSNDKIMQYMMAKLPIQRVGTTEEVAYLAHFLLSGAAAYCTGAVFTVDGGFTI